MLILAYAIMFFPLALVGVRASVAQAPPGLEEVARSLGRPRLEVLWRLTLPLVITVRLAVCGVLAVASAGVAARPIQVTCSSWESGVLMTGS